MCTPPSLTHLSTSFFVVVTLVCLFVSIFFETVFHYTVQTGLELKVLFPQPPECRDYRHVIPWLVLYLIVSICCYLSKHYFLHLLTSVDTNQPQEQGKGRELGWQGGP